MRKSRKRSRAPKSVAGIRRQLTYGPLQTLAQNTSGVAAVSTANTVGYTEIFSLTASHLNDLMDVYMPHYVVPGLAEGAPNTYTETPVMVQRRMDNAALGNRGSKLNFRGGNVTYIFRNNWDLPGTITLYLFKSTCSHAETLLDLAHHQVDENYRSDVSLSGLLMDGLTMHNQAIKEYWKLVGRAQTITLQPGEQFEYKFNLPKGIYDDTLNDLDGNQYVKGLSMSLIARMVGPIVHDSVTTSLVGYAPCQFDWVMRQYRSWRHVVDGPLSARFQLVDMDTVANPIAKVPTHEDQDGDGDGDD